MQDIYKTIIRNNSKLRLISNVKTLLLLLYMYRKKGVVKPGELAEQFNIEPEEVTNHISTLINHGLVEKIDWLDKSQKPPFIETGYRIKQAQYEKMFKDLSELVNRCLNTPD